MNRNLLIWTCPECKHEEDILLLNNNYCCSICGYTQPKKPSVPKSSQPTHIPQIPFQEQLRQLLQSIKDWDKLKKHNLHHPTIIFINKLTDLYLDYYQYHLDEVTLIAKEYINDLLWAAGVIRNHYVLTELEFFRDSYDLDESWPSVCWMASEIKIFDDMFGNIAAKINACEFWDFVEDYRNQRMYPGKIPKKIPDNHWWWFTEYDLECGDPVLC